MASLKEKQQTVFNHYGLANQLIKLFEESDELRDEFDHNGIFMGNDFLSELADLCNMCDQIKQHAGEERITAIQHEKMDRQLKRMEGDKNV